MNRISVGVMVIGLALCLCALETAAAAAPGLPDRVEEALWWLPEDTQTVIVAQGPFHKDRFHDYRELVGRLGLQPEEDQGPLAGRTIAVTVRGSRHFRSAKAVGAWPYEGAEIMVYEKPLGDAWQVMRKLRLASIENDLKTDELTLDRIRGHEVIVTRKKQSEDVWTEFLTHPSPTVVIRATNRSYVDELLQRMEKKAKARALPASLPEWKSLGQPTPIWAIRHYDRKDFDDDPSSPLSNEPQLGSHDDQAIGVVFSFEPEKSRVATVQYLSGHVDALGVTKLLWHQPENDLTPDIRSGPPGVIQVRMAIDGRAGQQKPSGMFFLLLGAVLGHGTDY